MLWQIIAIVGICTRIHLWVPVESIKEILMGYNCGMNILDYENIS